MLVIISLADKSVYARVLYLYDFSFVINKYLVGRNFERTQLMFIIKYYTLISISSDNFLASLFLHYL